MLCFKNDFIYFILYIFYIERQRGSLLAHVYKLPLLIIRNHCFCLSLLFI